VGVKVGQRALVLADCRHHWGGGGQDGVQDCQVLFKGGPATVHRTKRDALGSGAVGGDAMRSMGVCKGWVYRTVTSSFRGGLATVHRAIVT